MISNELRETWTFRFPFELVTLKQYMHSAATCQNFILRRQANLVVRLYSFWNTNNKKTSLIIPFTIHFFLRGDK
jgi:hypothetical protein